MQGFATFLIAIFTIHFNKSHLFHKLWYVYRDIKFVFAEGQSEFQNRFWHALHVLFDVHKNVWGQG